MQDKLKHLFFGENLQKEYKVVILVKEDCFNKNDLYKYYVEPIISKCKNVKLDDIIFINLPYDGKTVRVKDTAKPWCEYLDSIVKARLIIVADSAYFKVLADVKKTSLLFGTACDSKYPHLNTNNTKIFLAPNYKSIFYDDKNQDKLDITLGAVCASLNNKLYFKDILKGIKYLYEPNQITEYLKSILDKPLISCDIETADLKHYRAGIYTIAFATSVTEAATFPIDLSNKGDSSQLRDILSQFFIEYLLVRKNKIIWHNINFDAKVLIWELLMKGKHINKEQMLQGLDLFANSDSFEDTKIIAYLATNSCQGNELSLKYLSLPYTGNYALNEDHISNLKLLDLKEVLRYNAIDALATFYVYEQYHPRMVKENQLNVYNTIFKPSVKTLLQMELHGMPLDMDAVLSAKSKLSNIINDCINKINNNPYVVDYIELKACIEYHIKHYEWKQKTAPLREFQEKAFFNCGSGHQLAQLLFDVLDLPVLEYTKKKQRATGGKILEALVNHTKDPVIKDLLQNIIDFSAANKILTTFIPAFQDAYKCPDTGNYYLMGNFNLGGTVSGRLSCKNPNLQQIPSNSTYAKLIKKCFKAPNDDYLMIGLDFNSLEDYISALTTKDPNKLKVYLEGYDGHSLRAFSYFPEKLTDITNTVESINSIADKYPDVRQESKAPTFALTYQGTYLTLMKNCGFSEAMAKQIEGNFQELYKVSIEYIKEKLDTASETGYVEVAFGLKVRTPTIKKSVWNSSKTTKEALAEGRTAGNACGQSYGMLNNRAANDFQNRTLNSKYRLDIWPIAHIHDSQYFIIKRDLNVLAWVNQELVDCVQWQELPEIQHNKVKLGGSLGVFYPDWSNELPLPNGMIEPIKIKEHLEAALIKNKE